ncbi:hypothetical protein [Streptomyces sp. NPDC085529]|uniref:hypothetical protein n=1 Tax=Streptomyces sp. NPDC085529 TaxID=3365729 RepID=UPI0037D79F40
MGVAEAFHADSSDPMVGRDHDLERIFAFLRQDASAALLLSGEPGVGQPRCWIPWSGLPPWRALGSCAAGAEFEADISYAALNPILLPLHGLVHRLSAPGRDSSV